MKNIARILSVLMLVTLVLGAVSVSADDTLLIAPAPGSSDEIIVTYPVYLVVEGPDSIYDILMGNYPIDGSVSAGDVIADLLADYDVTGLEDGYVTSVNGLAAGTFGGYDGWLYLVKYFVPNEEGAIEMYVDIPAVSVSDYAIRSSCSIVLYYGDMSENVVNVTATEDGKLQLVQCAPVYDENYSLVSFDISPLPEGTFTFRQILTDEKTGETSVSPDVITFTADENGVLPLSVNMEELKNGLYLGSAGKQSDVSAAVDGEEITMTEVVRHSDLYIVYNEPKFPEYKRKMMCMLLGRH